MTCLATGGDTHVPSRANGVPEWVTEEIRRADHTVHTGDFDSPAAYERLEGETFVPTHGTGSPGGWADRVVEVVREEAGSAAVGVAGHTHEVVDETVDGIRVLTPGSATGASPADRETMFVAELEEGGLEIEVLRG